DSSIKNINLLNTHTKEHVEEVMCVLDKKVTFDEAKKLLEESSGDIEIIKEKYEIAKTTGYKNLIGFMIKATRENWQMSKKQEPERDNNANKTRFHNFEQRTRSYTPEQLKDMVLNKRKK